MSSLRTLALRTAPLFLAASLAGAPAFADAVTCTVSVQTKPGAAGTLSAKFDFADMRGLVGIDAGADARRIQVKAVPYSASYLLMFNGYAAGDHKPAGEKLRRGKSVVARLVAYGNKNHLFFDSDLKLDLPAPADGFACAE
jgi:hypothetical protein